MKKLFVIFCLIFAMGAVSAQRLDVVPLPRNLQNYKARNYNDTARKVDFLVGGHVGFSVGGNALQFQLSPHFGILPAVKWLCLGVGGTYQLYYQKDYYSGLKSFSHIFGARGFIEGLIWQQRIVIHGEYEWLSYPDCDSDGIRESTQALLVGPGYQQFIGDRLSVYGLFLFPVYEPKSNPINAYSIMEIRVGVNFKF